ncbi:hypothetical protein I5Q34_06090 [Streptomyces sp. AV19]|uniref:hypothetical protein n=1 Tax=Streptomyces sp. AV19 TaxID=2793068 RepID=UPI0018FE53D1|nr:hypothetical protein [Streptomyces sp. AV19]MBH1933868.1 hypothetical protein [Streptomyces sp. AV19]MDG4535644.1 hypothetical protein [Streptomyces sp. AV19]
MRHVRATAAFGIAVVALTGARGSHGGSCGGGGSSHHGSGSGGSSTTSGGTSGDTSGGTTTTSGGTTTGTTGTTGDSTTTNGGTTTIGGSHGSSRNSAMRDIKILGCDYSDRFGITAKLSATNSSATLTYNYRLTMRFTAPDGTRTTRNPSIILVGPGRTSTQDVSTPYVPKPGAPAGSGRCEVTDVVRTTA